MDNCNLKRILLQVLLAASLVGCTSLPSEDGGAPEGLPRSIMPATDPAAAEAAPDKPVEADRLAEPTPRPEPSLLRGNDRIVNLPARPPSKGVEKTRNGIALHFEQASVTDVAHAVLGDLLNVSYAIHQPITGSITVHTHGVLPRDQILSLFESVLTANGLTMTVDAKGVYQIGTSDVMRNLVAGVSGPSGLQEGYSNVIVPLKHVGAAEMADILRPLAPADAIVRVDTLRNLLLLRGSRGQVEGWLEIVDTFDVDLLSGMSVGVFPLEYASVKDVSEALTALLSSSSLETTQNAQGAAGGMARSADGRRASRSSSAPNAPTGTAANGASESLLSPAVAFGPLYGLLKVFPIERLNSLLVVTPRAEYLDKVKTWIAKIDRPGKLEAGPQLYVYPVQNGTATHLAQLLNGVFGSTGGDTSSRSIADAGIAPGLRQGGVASLNSTYTSGSTKGGSPGGSLSSLSAQATGANAQQPALTQVTLKSDVRVVADEFNNALLIYAPRREYRNIEAALRRLDQAPSQVLIEASIVEVTLKDQLKYGLQWYFTNNIRGQGWSAAGTLGNGTDGSIVTANPGFNYQITNAAGAVMAVLNALASKSLVNVISSPSVLVQDNHTATIKVGEQQPIQTSTSITTVATTSSYEYKDTGVILQVTPSVNAGKMVTMDINQTLTDLGTYDSKATGQYSFLERQVSSRVSVRSGETLVLGGLIKDNSSRGKDGIPYLKDIPVLGNLFGTTSIDKQKTELVVMITPKVVESDAELRATSSEYKERMKTLREGLKEIGSYRSVPSLDTRPVPRAELPPVKAHPEPAGQILPPAQPAKPEAPANPVVTAPESNGEGAKQTDVPSDEQETGTAVE